MISTLIALYVSNAAAGPRVTSVSQSHETVRFTVEHDDESNVHPTCEGLATNVIGALDPSRPAAAQFFDRIVRVLEQNVDQPARVSQDRDWRTLTLEDLVSEGGGLQIYRDRENQVVRIVVERSPAWPEQTITDHASIARVLQLIAKRAQHIESIVIPEED